MDKETVGDLVADEPPKYGLKIPLNHVYPLQSKQLVIPSVKQSMEFVPLFTRYIKYHIGRKMNNKNPVMNYLKMLSAQKIYGCPIGGIGGGTIGRGFRGEFCRFQLTPGLYKYVTVPECQFIVNIRNGNNETIFQSVLSAYPKPKKAPPSWEWNLDPGRCEYTGLYPRAWTTYDLSKYGIRLVCRQISPIIPHNYKDSSLPCAVFVFTAQNVCNEQRKVSITFTWTEVLAPRNRNKSLAKLDLERYSEEHTCGVTLEQKIGEAPCTFTIAKKKDETETIHDGYCLWNAKKTSGYLWECISKHGKVQPDPGLTPPPPKVPDKADREKEIRENEKNRKIYKCDSIALSSVMCLEAGTSDSTEFCLAWDMPVIKYKKEKVVYKRFYTKFFGSDGIAGAGIAAHALKHYTNWEKFINEWQHSILSNSSIPDWLKSALMNELYFVADGGTMWLDAKDDFPDTDPRHHYGLFGYLEGHEYKMYNTYDVHFYASFALAQLWPNLQVVLQYMFRDTIAMETEKSRISLYDGKSCKFKVKDSIPHDLGDPEGVPFKEINSYNIYDISQWRDLNLKFVLVVGRDVRVLRAHSGPLGAERSRALPYIDDVPGGTEDELYCRSTGQTITPPSSPEVTEKPPVLVQPKQQGVGDILDLLYRSTNYEKEESMVEETSSGSGSGIGSVEGEGEAWGAAQYVRDMYGACAGLARRAARWDADGDGLIENTGIPDQTFDAWVMTGPSAYCGGLWVGALRVVCSLARTLGRREDEEEFAALLRRAQQAYDDKLWNGNWYKFDTKPANSHVVMADQLAGHWFLRASGFNEQIFPEEKVRKALEAIYAHNVMQFRAGKLGAVNGFEAGRGRVDTTAMQSEEAWTGVTYGLAALMIYEGMHEEAFVTAGGMYNTLTDMGLAFQTPEALFENGNHRSVAYMRPLAVWAMYQAILARPPPPVVGVNGQAIHTKDKL